MKNIRTLGIFWIFSFSLFSLAHADDSGRALFHAVTTNLDGSGIAVAQAEAALDANYQEWEVNPASVGLPASLFTYASSNGTASIFPNSVGSESGHADGVGNLMYGSGSGFATNVARVDGFEADYFINTYVMNTVPAAIIDPVVNQSFAFGQLSVADQEEVDQDYDNAAVKNKTLFISSPGNYGTSSPNTTNATAPGTAYNSIAVGAYSGGTFGNAIGPTLDNGRCKPDLSAPWGETSGAVPQVAGAAAVLMQAALRGDGGSDTNSASDLRTIKALLLNGAVKTPDWTNSNSSPLDLRYGAGLLNIFNSYEQLIGGKNNYIANTMNLANGAHPPNGATGTITNLAGWDFNTNTSAVLQSSNSINHYYFNLTGNSPSTLKATLVWNRHDSSLVFSPGPEGINNLNLFLYNCANSNLVNCSTSVVDNVEHIYMTNLPAGRYDLQVWKAGGATIVSAAEPYALAWNFISAPSTLPVLQITSAGNNATLTWPILPDGFVLESATNLNPPIIWSTNDIPAPTYANGQNIISVSATNTAQFFRLLWVSP